MAKALKASGGSRGAGPAGVRSMPNGGDFNAGAPQQGPPPSTRCCSVCRGRADFGQWLDLLITRVVKQPHCRNQADKSGPFFSRLVRVADLGPGQKPPQPRLEFSDERRGAVTGVLNRTLWKIEGPTAESEELCRADWGDGEAQLHLEVDTLRYEKEAERRQPEDHSIKSPGFAPRPVWFFFVCNVMVCLGC